VSHEFWEAEPVRQGLVLETLQVPKRQRDRYDRSGFRNGLMNLALVLAPVRRTFEFQEIAVVHICERLLRKPGSFARFATPRRDRPPDYGIEGGFNRDHDASPAAVAANNEVGCSRFYTIALDAPWRFEDL
jgi:hypothetical protein